MNYYEYKDWLGSRDDTMANRSEYNYITDGALATSGGLVGAQSGRVIASGGYGGAYNGAKQAQSDLAMRKLEKQINAAVERLNGQKQEVSQGYEQAAQQAYINKMLSAKNLQQYNSAMGYSGGISESSRLALENSYGSTLAGLLQSKNSSIAQLEKSIAEVKNSGQLEMMELENKFLAELYEQAESLKEKYSIKPALPAPEDAGVQKAYSSTQTAPVQVASTGGGTAQAAFGSPTLSGGFGAGAGQANIAKKSASNNALNYAAKNENYYLKKRLGKL